jgi:hypothetical protein
VDARGKSAKISKRYYTKSNNKRRLLRQLEKKILRLPCIFVYVDYPASTTSASTISPIVACHAWGLVVAHLCKLSATLGGSTSSCPGVRKITVKTCDFIDISNTAIPTALGGSTTTSPPIVVVILRQQLTYLCIIDYGHDHVAPDKS